MKVIAFYQAIGAGLPVLIGIFTASVMEPVSYTHLFGSQKVIKRFLIIQSQETGKL